MSESIKNKATPSAPTSFVNCGEDNIKIEIKEEKTLDEDPLSIKMETDNIEETIKQEEGIQDKDPLSYEQIPDEDRINTLDIVEHKIER